MPEKIAQIFTFTKKVCAVFSYANHRNLHSQGYSELSKVENQQKTVHGLKSQPKLCITPNAMGIHAQKINVYLTIAHLECKDTI